MTGRFESRARRFRCIVHCQLSLVNSLFESLPQRPGQTLHLLRQLLPHPGPGSVRRRRSLPAKQIPMLFPEALHGLLQGRAGILGSADLLQLQHGGYRPYTPASGFYNGIFHPVTEPQFLQFLLMLGKNSLRHLLRYSVFQQKFLFDTSYLVLHYLYPQIHYEHIIQKYPIYIYPLYIFQYLL